MLVVVAEVTDWARVRQDFVVDRAVVIVVVEDVHLVLGLQLVMGHLVAMALMDLSTVESK